MGKLHLLGLPIGNDKDYTARCLEVLTKEENFFVEDTRVFLERLKRLGISTDGKKIVSFHDKDERRLTDAIDLLDRGIDIYFASDAGSPVISDPAFPLIRSVLDKGYQIEGLPGVSSLITALELSGLAPHPFYFYGFLPKEKEKRRSFFMNSLHSSGTYIFFESPHRVSDTVEIFSKQYPDVEICLARELTKTFQEILRFRGSEWNEVKEKMIFKGEFVFLFHLKIENQLLDNKMRKLAQDVLERPDSKRLSKLLGPLLGLNNKEAYSILLKNSKNSNNCGEKS